MSSTSENPFMSMVMASSNKFSTVNTSSSFESASATTKQARAHLGPHGWLEQPFPAQLRPLSRPEQPFRTSRRPQSALEQHFPVSLSGSF